MSGTRGSAMPSFEHRAGANRETASGASARNPRKSSRSVTIALLRRIEGLERRVGVVGAGDPLQRVDGIGDLGLGGDILGESCAARCARRSPAWRRRRPRRKAQRPPRASRCGRRAPAVAVGSDEARRDRGRPRPARASRGAIVVRRGREMVAVDPERREAALDVEDADRLPRGAPVAGADRLPDGALFPSSSVIDRRLDARRATRRLGRAAPGGGGRRRRAAARGGVRRAGERGRRVGRRRRRRVERRRRRGRGVDGPTVAARSA